MKKVTVKAQCPHYDGFMRGFKFYHGIAKDVPIEDAEAMKEFGVEILDEPKAKLEPVKEPKRSPRKKVGE